ncbi:MAG: hypothetical protein OFPI_23690 [Osedax symbiont Rs2]|nr:MAG: hypothetical protein OFPI_23690 [Osedax symbiont Rs2]
MSVPKYSVVRYTHTQKLSLCLGIAGQNADTVLQLQLG